MNFYIAPGPGDLPRLQQGDIVSPVPFHGFDLARADVIPAGRQEYEPRDLSTPQANEVMVPGTRILSTVESCPGIILNQTCDLADEEGRRKPVLIARVVPCAKRVKGFQAGEVGRRIQEIDKLANPGRSPNVFFLPQAMAGPFELPCSVADLLEVACFPATAVGYLSRFLRLRLSAPALQALQERLAYCFGRFGAPDDLYYSDEEWQFRLRKRDR